MQSKQCRMMSGYQTLEHSIVKFKWTRSWSCAARWCHRISAVYQQVHFEMCACANQPCRMMSGDQTLEHSCAHSIIHSIPLSFNCKQKPFHQLTLSSPSNSSQGHQKPPWTRGFMWIFWDWGRPSRRGSFHSHINFWLCSSIWNGNKIIFTPMLQIYLGLCTGPSWPCPLTS